MIKRFIKLLYKKWVKGNCKHCCSFCEYRKEPMIFVSITNGTIAEESMGCYG